MYKRQLWFLAFVLALAAIVYAGYQGLVAYERVRWDGLEQDITPAIESGMANGIYFFMGALAAFFFLPVWSATVRRLHDAGFSGWWSVLGIVSAGLVPFLKESQPQPNRWGPVPVQRVKADLDAQQDAVSVLA